MSLSLALTPLDKHRYTIMKVAAGREGRNQVYEQEYSWTASAAFFVTTHTAVLLVVLWVVVQVVASSFPVDASSIDVPRRTNGSSTCPVG